MDSRYFDKRDRQTLSIGLLKCIYCEKVYSGGTIRRLGLLGVTLRETISKIKSCEKVKFLIVLVYVSIDLCGLMPTT